MASSEKPLFDLKDRLGERWTWIAAGVGTLAAAFAFGAHPNRASAAAETKISPVALMAKTDKQLMELNQEMRRDAAVEAGIKGWHNVSDNKHAHIDGTSGELLVATHKIKDHQLYERFVTYTLAGDKVPMMVIADESYQPGFNINEKYVAWLDLLTKDAGDKFEKYQIDIFTPPNHLSESIKKSTPLPEAAFTQAQGFINNLIQYDKKNIKDAHAQALSSKKPKA